MTYSLTWLPTVLRAAGLNVVELPGWQTRGQGDVGKIEVLICHHTAEHQGTSEPVEADLIEHGRSDLHGCLAQLMLGKDGTYYVVAAGLAYHAGQGGWKGITGNAHAIGIEAENDGLKEPWPAVQMNAYERGSAAILKHLGLGVDMCIGHKEWTPRKSDPDFDMDVFRRGVASLLGAVSPFVKTTATHAKQPIKPLPVVIASPKTTATPAIPQISIPARVSAPVAAPPVGTVPMAPRKPFAPAARPVGLVARFILWLENIVLAAEAKKSVAGGPR